MSIEFILIPLTFIALAIASYTDVRTREVPDWLSYGFLFAVVGIRVLFSIQEGWNVLISGVLGFAVFCAIAFALYYSRQWGGADAKLLMGLGVVIGLSFPFSAQSFSLLLFFFLVMIIGSVYGFSWMIGLAIRRWSEVRPAFLQQLVEQRKIWIVNTALTLVLLIASFSVPLLWILAPIPLFLTLFLLFVSVMEKTCFHKTVPPAAATEGDWLAQDVKVGSKVVMLAKELQREDVAKLREWQKSKKVTQIVIKEGVPFVPSFLFGYIAFLVLKDLPLASFFTLLG